MHSQITTAASATAGIIVALIAGAVAITKKLLARAKPKPEHITRAEFHDGMDKVRDRIGASYLALANKLDTHHRDLQAAIERQGAAFEHRLDQLESNLARLDERTRTIT